MLSYIFLMQYNSSLLKLTDVEANRTCLMTQIGGAVTMIGCVLNLCLLCLLPLKSDGFVIIGNMCVVMIAAQLSLLGSENANYPDPIMCKLAGCLIQYFYLCVHCASFAYALYLWSRFGPSYLSSCRRNGVYLLLIWCVPIILVLGTVITAGDQYGKEDSCWLPDGPSRLWFLIPVYILLTANFVLYVLICRYSLYMSINRPGHTTSRFRQLAMTALSLKPVLGQFWFLGLAVTFNGPVLFQYLYVTLASTQGMLILIFHMLTHGQIQKALCEKVATNASELSSATSGHNTGQSVMRPEHSDNPKSPANDDTVPSPKTPTKANAVATSIAHNDKSRSMTPSSPNKTSKRIASKNADVTNAEVQNIPNDLNLMTLESPYKRSSVSARNNPSMVNAGIFNGSNDTSKNLVEPKTPVQTSSITVASFSSVKRIHVVSGNDAGIIDD